ncbi:diacylglycerol acyltransferase-domain-containing protein [Lasiosphaeris hirsuta]|uniref:diacylglycerol O-acyltransferase n=1 Tax=Lasiosphaeris hirsuta TaxID=260670 RepID=A0AA40BAI6_9PEZI|nr:diacylglycerol acyltransferase-domain-containing protein [Lasiosphaeris hirsuta]
MEGTADQENPPKRAQGGKKKGATAAAGSSGKKANGGKKVASQKEKSDGGGGSSTTTQSQVLRVVDTNAAPHDTGVPADEVVPVPVQVPVQPATERRESEKENETDGHSGDRRTSSSTPLRTRLLRSKTETQDTTAQVQTQIPDTARDTTEEVEETPSKSAKGESVDSIRNLPTSAEVDGIGGGGMEKESETMSEEASKDNTVVNDDGTDNGELETPIDFQDNGGIRKRKSNGATLARRSDKTDAPRKQEAGVIEGRFLGYDEYPPLSIDENDRESRARERSYYRAYGVRFAPWNIPFKRRLQTLAVMIHCLSIASTVSFFFFLCAIPLTWPLLIPYLLHMLLSKAAIDGRLRFRSERFRQLPIWKFFADYYPARLHKTHDIPPTRKYIFGYHPHGIISHGAFAAFGTEALGFSEKFPGITNSLLTLDSNFRIPLYREYILSLGIQSVSKDSITNILTHGGTNGEGMGRAVTIVVGGARESLEAQPGTMHLVLGERKGFVKLAIRTGADLVPVLAFGENDLYDQVSPKTHPSLHRLQMYVLKTLKFTLPFLHGRGIFNYDVGLMPYRRSLNIVVGKPIKVVAPPEGQPVDMAEVERLHRVYVEELRKMWERYKDVFAGERDEEMMILN